MFVVDDRRFVIGFAAVDFDSALPNDAGSVPGYDPEPPPGAPAPPSPKRRWRSRVSAATGASAGRLPENNRGGALLPLLHRRDGADRRPGNELRAPHLRRATSSEAAMTAPVAHAADYAADRARNWAAFALDRAAALVPHDG